MRSARNDSEEPVSEEPVSEEPVSEEPVSDYLIRITDASIKMENDRYSSLMSLNSRLLTCVSILAVASTGVLSMVAEPLAHTNANDALWIVASLVLLSLAIALLFALIAQVRFPYYALNAPAKYQEYSLVDEGELPQRLDVAKLYIEAYDPVFRSIRERNEKIYQYSKVSIVCVIVALSLAVAGSLCIAVMLRFPSGYDFALLLTSLIMRNALILVIVF